MPSPAPTLLEILTTHFPELMHKGKRTGIHFTEVAKAMGCSRQQVNNIHRGKCRIGYRSAKNLVAYSKGRITLDHLDPLISNNRS